MPSRRVIHESGRRTVLAGSSNEHMRQEINHLRTWITARTGRSRTLQSAAMTRRKKDSPTPHERADDQRAAAQRRPSGGGASFKNANVTMYGNWSHDNHGPDIIATDTNIDAKQMVFDGPNQAIDAERSRLNLEDAYFGPFPQEREQQEQRPSVGSGRSFVRGYIPGVRGRTCPECGWEGYRWQNKCGSCGGVLPN